MAIVPEWIEAHCVVPDGFRAGEPFRLYDKQLLFIANHYLVRGDAAWVPDNPILAASFVHRRSLVVAPQKWGKNPLGAVMVCAEGGGPTVFADWAGQDDGYACADHGCGCGWEYAYDPGEPMGMPWPTPHIQLLAVNEAQTANTWKLLRPMIAKGPLADLWPDRGEGIIRLRPDDGNDDPSLVERVTTAELSKLGARSTFVLEDQVESYTSTNGADDVADTVHRNLAGVGGRAAMLANAWDPTQHSVAQRDWESDDPGIYRQATWPPRDLCADVDHDHFEDPLERRAIFEAVYPIDHRREGNGHIDLDTVEPEAAAIYAFNPAQAKRWFGNMLVEGSGKAFDLLAFIERRVKRRKVVPDGALITIGIDGSVRWDHFPLIATEVASGYQWPLHIWTPAGPEREVDGEAVERVLEQAFGTWDVWRVYADPPYIESWLAKWAARWGKDRIHHRPTASVRLEAYRMRAWKQAIATGELSHCHEKDRWCALFTEHVGNAVRRDTGYRDDDGFLWTVEKDRQGSPRKIDSVPAAGLSWEARLHAIAEGALNLEETVSAYDDSEWLVDGKPRGILA